MGIALRMISGGDVALLTTRISRQVARSPRELPSSEMRSSRRKTGTTVSALLGGAVVTLSYGHLLWANAMLSWIPVLLVLRLTEPPAALNREKRRAEELKEMLSTTLVRDAETRLVFLNKVAWGTGGLVMFWVNQKYWQESGVPWPLSGSSWLPTVSSPASPGEPPLSGGRDTAGDHCSPRSACCPSSRISGWRLSSVGAGYCSGSWPRSAGAWARCCS